jgi:hypothetical protein
MAFHCGRESFRGGFATNFLYTLLDGEKLIRLLRSIHFTPLLQTRVSQSLKSILLEILQQITKRTSSLVFSIQTEEFYLPVLVNITLKFMFHIFLHFLCLWIQTFVGLFQAASMVEVRRSSMICHNGL